MEDGKSRSIRDHFRYATQSVTRNTHFSADRSSSPESTQKPVTWETPAKLRRATQLGPLNKPKRGGGEEGEGGGQNLLSGKWSSVRSGTCGNHY